MDDIIEVEPDRVAEALAVINASGKRIASTLEKEVSKCIEIVAPINGIFWNDPRIGNKGTALLQKLGDHVALIATHFPKSMNATLAGAGVALTPNTDGTVTYTPPEVEEEQPE